MRSALPTADETQPGSREKTSGINQQKGCVLVTNRRDGLIVQSLRESSNKGQQVGDSKSDSEEDERLFIRTAH
ncbi:hypothetical protein EVAR_78820_1 [Eumeta japonica]|uniref:Uncharacterized protein n=1 Tax=Eumeta variegata TaxID=151549 RepID=A0A4C1T2E7_EUMVA|nr:hypothetical protein EVAR_78820_1 [Eumeta japonica]